VGKWIVLSRFKNEDADWISRSVASITLPWQRLFTNDVLIKVVLEFKNFGNLDFYQSLFQACRTDLQNRVDNKPQPPKDWSREVPKHSYPPSQFHVDMIANFLRSPTQQVFDYSRILAVRKEMESALRGVEVDVRMETVRNGSPHTLRITKTQASYERALANWNVDVKLLEQVKAVKIS
jgi:hypothetical protein